MAKDNCVSVWIEEAEDEGPFLHNSFNLEGKPMMTRTRVAFEFVHEATSPLCRALECGVDLLDNGARDKNWKLAVAFGRTSEETLVKEIWEATVPAQARLWFFKIDAIDALPLRLLLLLGNSPLHSG